MESMLAVIAIVISVLASAGSMIYTHRQMKEAKRANDLTEKAQREQMQPYVIADIRERSSGSQLLCFFIENIGPTMARDVQVTVSPPLQTTQGDETATQLNQAVARKIAMMPPGRRLMFRMDYGGTFFASTLPRLYTVVINSSGPFGPLEPLTYTLDLNILENALLDRESLEWSTHMMAKEAKRANGLQERQLGIMGQVFRMMNEEVEVRREARRVDGEDPQSP
ncbi:hypothetical protein PV367_37730 [Streptomyces europaeiscabiei]|uniref:Uncharacterized protein n=1 Tax=Streptomyces europaeiscabiei TaxID=146819 RepID=A0AAJ2PX57_9ACTN|nr:hypothetical protein [Streptomyces europaeiscabiei]MDX3135408.1 hypothetical protein [Streptomyces europaeiscabiei]